MKILHIHCGKYHSNASMLHCHLLTSNIRASYSKRVYVSTVIPRKHEDTPQPMYVIRVRILSFFSSMGVLDTSLNNNI